jgi:hypothetical protein
MEIPYDEAMTVLRSWKSAEHLPPLIVDFAVSSLANVHALCEEIEVSDDILSLFFGRVYDGNGQLNIPLQHTRFTLVKPSDKPFDMRSHHDEAVVCWLELKTHQDNGCVITQFKPGFITVAGIGPLDVVYKASRKP